MADFGENFRAGREKVLYILCNLHLDSQDMCPACPVLRKYLNRTGNYSDLYSNNVSVETVADIEKAMEYRSTQNQDNLAINGPCVTVSIEDTCAA